VSIVIHGRCKNNICYNALVWDKNYKEISAEKISYASSYMGRLCGLVVRVLGYRSGGPGSIPGTTKKKVVGLEWGPLNL
jgi:hypothetical protein